LFVGGDPEACRLIRTKAERKPTAVNRERPQAGLRRL